MDDLILIYNLLFFITKFFFYCASIFFVHYVINDWNFLTEIRSKFWSKLGDKYKLVKEVVNSPLITTIIITIIVFAFTGFDVSGIFVLCGAPVVVEFINLVFKRLNPPDLTVFGLNKNSNKILQDDCIKVIEEIFKSYQTKERAEQEAKENESGKPDAHFKDTYPKIVNSLNKVDLSGFDNLIKVVRKNKKPKKKK